MPWYLHLIHGEHVGNSGHASFAPPSPLDRPTRQSMYDAGWRGAVRDDTEGRQYLELSMAWGTGEPEPLKHAGPAICGVLRHVLGARDDDDIVVTFDDIVVTFDDYFCTVHGWAFDAKMHRLTGTGKVLGRPPRRPTEWDHPAWNLYLDTPG